METRKVTIINSRSQSQKVIQDSKATTLGELKAEMRERGIDYSGMTFYEGHMRAELKDDAAPLPTNIPYKGQVVNDLTFMLTAPEKNIKSGAMSRAEAYTAIKNMGLQEVCKTKYGKNFTQCSTADLISVIEAGKDKTAKEVKKTKEVKPVKPVAEEKKEEKKEIAKNAESIDCNVVNAITALVDGLYDNHKIEEELRDKVITILNGGTYTAPEKMSQREIDEMFGFVPKK